MTGKEYLESIGRLDHKIRAMKMRCKEYERLSLVLPGQDFTKDRIDSTPDGSPGFVKWINKKIDLESRIKEYEVQLKELQTEAIIKIESLEDENQKNVLMMKYLKYLNWDEMAKELYVSKSTCKRWHDRGLTEMDEMVKSL